MRIKDKYELLKTAAQQDVHDVRNRRTVFCGSYPKGTASLDGVALLHDVKTARSLGYETHLRIADGCIEVYFVANLPPAPSKVLYA